MVWYRLAPEESREKCSSIAGTSRKSMRNFARSVALAVIVLAPAVHAQTSSPSQAKKLYDDALMRVRPAEHAVL